MGLDHNSDEPFFQQDAALIGSGDGSLVASAVGVGYGLHICIFAYWFGFCWMGKYL